MSEQQLTKEVTYKGNTKTFTVEIEQLPPFNPETMDKEKYDETQVVLAALARKKLENQKMEWVFNIEKALQEEEQ